MVNEGWHNYECPKKDRYKKLLVGEFELYRKDVINYFNRDSIEIINWYNDVKKYGFPFSRGWYDHPAIWIDIIKAFDSEVGEYNGKGQS